MKQKEIIRASLSNSMSYTEYRRLIDGLLDLNKTTGPDNSEDMLRYTHLNVNRMRKWDKHFKLDASTQELINNLESDELWLVITEGWCGDAAHIVPVLEAFAESSPRIELKLVLRDENPELMDLFLTNGSRSIPKLIRLEKDSLDFISEWGPRPNEGQDMVMTMKENGTPKSDISKNIQLWYARDRGKSTERDLVNEISGQMETV